ncbi:MAG: hypothetical protein Q8R55_04630 [Candidatus Taylorbacteria bacterium]|nr:hypothetical protein [Candidatus Taylorbacteria bacterium]
MAFHGAWSKELDKRLKEHWRTAKKDRDKFKEIVESDKVLMKEKTWMMCDLHARQKGWYKTAKPSKKSYPFTNLHDKGEELLAMLGNDDILWDSVMAKYPQYTKSRLHSFAKNNGVKINKKEAEKAAKQEESASTPEQAEKELIEKRKKGEISIVDFLEKIDEKSEIKKQWAVISKLIVEKRVVRNTDFLPYAKEMGCNSSKKLSKLNYTRGVLNIFDQWDILAQVNMGSHVSFLCNLPDFYSPEELHKIVPDHVINTLFSNLNSGEKAPFAVLVNSMQEVLGTNLVRTLLAYFVQNNILVKLSKGDSYQLTGAAKLIGTDKDSLFELDLFEADNVLDQKETAEAALAISSLDDVDRMVKEDLKSKRVKEVEVSTGKSDSIRIVMMGEQRYGNQFTDVDLIKSGIELVQRINPDFTVVSGLVQGDHKSFQVERLRALVKGPLGRVSAQIKTAGLLMDCLSQASKIGVYDVLGDDDWNVGKSRALIAMKELLVLRRVGMGVLWPTEISRLSGRDFVRFMDTQWEYVAPYMHRLGRSLYNAEEVSALNPNLRKDELLLIMIVLLYKKFGHEYPDSIKKVIDPEALFGDKKGSKRFVTPDPLLIKWVEGDKSFQFVHNTGYSDVTQNLDSLIVMEKGFRQLLARGEKIPNFVFDFQQERFFGTNVSGSFIFNLPGCQNTLSAASRRLKTFNTQIVGEKSHKQNTFRKEPVSSGITDFQVYKDGRFKFRILNNAVRTVLENSRTVPEEKGRLALFQDIQTGSPTMRLEWTIKAHDLALYGPNPVNDVSYNGDIIHGRSIYPQFVSESRIKRLVSIKSQQAMAEKVIFPFYPAPTVKHVDSVLGNHEWDNLMAKFEGGDPLSFLSGGLNTMYSASDSAYKQGLKDAGYTGKIVSPYEGVEIYSRSRGRMTNSGNPDGGGTLHWPYYTRTIGGGYKYAVQHKWQPYGGGGRTPVDGQIKWATNMAKSARDINVMFGGHYHSFWVAMVADILMLQMPGLVDQSGFELGFGLSPLSLFCMVEFSNKDGITVEMYSIEYLMEYQCVSPFYKDKNELLVRPKPGTREYDYGFDSPLIHQWEEEVDSLHLES